MASASFGTLGELGGEDEASDVASLLGSEMKHPSLSSEMNRPTSVSRDSMEPNIPDDLQFELAIAEGLILLMFLLLLVLLIARFICCARRRRWRRLKTGRKRGAPKGPRRKRRQCEDDEPEQDDSMEDESAEESWDEEDDDLMDESPSEVSIKAKSNLAQRITELLDSIARPGTPARKELNATVRLDLESGKSADEILAKLQKRARGRERGSSSSKKKSPPILHTTRQVKPAEETHRPEPAAREPLKKPVVNENSRKEACASAAHADASVNEKSDEAEVKAHTCSTSAAPPVEREVKLTASLDEIIMSGPQWDRRRARANDAFAALAAEADYEELIQPWDSISNVMPASIVTVNEPPVMTSRGAARQHKPPQLSSMAAPSPSCEKQPPKHGTEDLPRQPKRRPYCISVPDSVAEID